MIKILYAAENNKNAKIQLYRFHNAIKNKNYIVKYAAFKKHSPNINIDYTLDSLFSNKRPNARLLDNDNLSIYYDNIKNFKPDIIISDFEYFTSYIAKILNIIIIQCSSSIITAALTNKFKWGLNVSKDFYGLVDANNTEFKLNTLNNSSIKLVYSHFGDTPNPPPLLEGYEWVRPYHSIARPNVLARHNFVSPTENKKIINMLKSTNDSIIFNENDYEEYKNVVTKNIYNDEEYFSNLKNCDYFICEGQTSFLADAYYNGVYSYTLVDGREKESVYNSYISRKLGLSDCIYSKLPSEKREITINLNNVKYLHEIVEDIL